MLYSTQPYFTLLCFWPDYGPCGCSADQSTPGTPTSSSSPSSLMIIFTIIIFVIITIILDGLCCYPQIKALNSIYQNIKSRRREMLIGDR